MKRAEVKNFQTDQTSKQPTSSPKGPQFSWKKVVVALLVVVILSSGFGFAAGVFSLNYFSQVQSFLSNFGINLSLSSTDTVVKENTVIEKQSVLKQEQLVTKAVKEISPSVVSIVITKDMPTYEQYYAPFGGFQIPQYRQEGTEKREIGSGTGFIVSKDGMVVTNKHVVANQGASYTVVTNQGKKYSARVIATDPFQDIALMQIESPKEFPVVELGNSDKLKIGQSVLTIGNALGEFRNTVSVGVVSGLGRTVPISGAGTALQGLIQTDAAVNQGNSGGTLVNMTGEVVGINTAKAQQAENIGFAIPINEAKRAIKQVKQTGEISYPFLGIRYTMITEELQENYNLEVSYGAWIGHTKTGQAVEQAVVPDSAANRAGLRRNDIILKFGGKKLSSDTSLADVIMNYRPGDQVQMKVLRNGQQINMQVKLGKRS